MYQVIPVINEKNAGKTEEIAEKIMPIVTGKKSV